MGTKKLTIAMNGVTGRMGYRQHLVRSLLPIRDEGLVLPDGTRVEVELILMGRRPEALEAMAKQHGIERWETDLDKVLADPDVDIYFDAQVTSRRMEALTKAMKAGKHIFTEKPTAETLEQAVELERIRAAAGVNAGVVHDKLYLPGLVKLRRLVEEGFFGRILSMRGEFGYWVFEGDHQPAQRPSWNYRKEDGGGMVVDMLCHWRYLIDNVFGPVQAVSCTTATHVKQRIDEAGKPFPCTADDAAYSTFRLVDGTIVHFNSSWCTRVRRDDLLTVQVDGSEGSAVATLRDVYLQPYGATPRAIWNPDIAQPIDFFDTWIKMPEQAGAYDNAFKIQWELFLRHVALDEPFRWTLLEGAKGVQLAEIGLKSHAERRWLDLPALDA